MWLSLLAVASAQDVGLVICDTGGIGLNVSDQLALHGMTTTVYDDLVAPNLAALQTHEAVIWSPCSRLPAVESVVTAYYLAGGPLVITAAYGEGIPGAGGGDWTGNGLEFFASPVYGSFYGVESIVVTDPTHPLVQGVVTYRGDTANYYSAGASFTAGVVVATWTNGEPLILDLSADLVFLNTWPANNLVSTSYVREDTDEDRLLANAVTFVADGDRDGDGIDANIDNCPDDFNPTQDDADGDGDGDACDACPTLADPVDSDGDGACDGVDLCPGYDDADDYDLDGVPTDCDTCPATPDPLQDDADGDGYGDACDACPTLADPDDTDGDGVCDSADICIGFDDTADDDTDGVPDGCDRCIGFDDGDDRDGDGSPDGCDPCPDDAGGDSDGDAYPDGCDNCPIDYNPTQGDIDSDSYGDACDCAPGLPQSYPGAGELCDGQDNDCDGEVDEDPIDGQTWYLDNDGDGQGSPGSQTTGCDEPAGYVDNADDCDDGSAEARLGGTEVCDGLDNDCDGDPDNGLVCDDGAVDDKDPAPDEGCGCQATPAGGPGGWLVSALRRRAARLPAGVRAP